tara:strand:+ start:57 stop:296 length:240 start_codon:yes stop_codon:yes gene_type:complete
MKFIQSKKDGSCDIVFSDKEIEIINKQKKLVLTDILLRHFGNVLMAMVAKWNFNFKDDVKNEMTYEDTVIEGKDDTSRK